MFKNILTLKVAIVLALALAAVLASGYGRDKGWLVDASGHPQAVELVGLRSAGELVNQGRPAAAYDQIVHGAQQQQLTRATNGDYYPFSYPPPMLAIAGLLAHAPYVASALIWTLMTLALMLMITMRLANERRAAIWTLATPTTFINAYVLHTGFLTAGLMGAGLLWLTTAPVASGVAFGLLAIKPQLGLMIPIALVAGGHWRTIAAACVTGLVMIAASYAAYGIDSWLAFLAQFDRVSENLRNNETNLVMVTSAYGLARTLGLSHAAAFVPQIALTAALAVTVFKLWRSDTAMPIKTAGLVVASLLAAPYLYAYDLTALPLAVVLLWTHTQNFDDTELGALLAAAALVLLFQTLPVPSGFFATLIVGGLVMRRWRAQASIAEHSFAASA